MVDPAGDKLGTIDAIYLDDETGQPEWALVYTGLFTAKIVFVPLAQAQATGDSVQVAEKHIPFFKTGKQLRDRLNQPTRAH